jgi:molybdopterin molybdotransferase
MPPTPAAASVLSFPSALALVLQHAAVLTPAERVLSVPPESIPLAAALHRILAQPILADRDQPPFDRSTRDGFALHAADTASLTPLAVLGQLRAGDRWTGPTLSPGYAIEIMTGAPIPPGADAVLMLEHATPSPPQSTPARIIPTRTLRPGENIVPRASEARSGATVVPSGTLLTPAEIALAATSGLSTLAVHPRPAVALLATGDELVPITQIPEPHQIRNSNTHALAALVTAAGGLPHSLPIARDTAADLHARIAEARALLSPSVPPPSPGLLLLSGGVSMGKFDLVEEVLTSLQAKFFFTGVLMQPGKPVVFGRLPALAATSTQPAAPACIFFGLPGNPVSTQVTFHCFVEPLLRALAGNTLPPPRFAQAILTEPIPAHPTLTRFLPAHLTSTFDGQTVRLVPWHGSGDLAANARANCYAVLPPGPTPFAPGAPITLLLR